MPAMSKEEYIRDFDTRQIIGILRHKPNGDIEAIEFKSRKILAIYRASTDDTIEFNTRRVVTKGNTVVSFIYEAFIEHLVRARPGTSPGDKERSQPCPRAGRSCSEEDKNWGGDTAGRRWDWASRDWQLGARQRQRRWRGGGGLQGCFGWGKDFLNMEHVAPAI